MLSFEYLCLKCNRQFSISTETILEHLICPFCSNENLEKFYLLECKASNILYINPANKNRRGLE